MLWMCSELTLQPRWCLGKSVRYPEGGDQGDMSQSPAVRQPSDQRDKLELQWPAALVLLSIKQPVGERGGKVAFGGVSLLFSQIASHLNNTDIQFLPLLIDNCGTRQHELLCPSLRGTDSDDNHFQKVLTHKSLHLTPGKAAGGTGGWLQPGLGAQTQRLIVNKEEIGKKLMIRIGFPSICVMIQSDTVRYSSWHNIINYRSHLIRAQGAENIPIC